MNILIFKFIQFSLVGLVGMVIDFGTTITCKEFLKWQKYLANSCGFLLAVCSNYLLNRHWTFGETHSPVLAAFFMFLVISLIGLLINNSVIWISHEKIRLKFYFSKFIAIGVTVFWNFLCNYFITFNTSVLADV